MGKSNQRAGNIGQEHAASALSAAGACMVERIATPVKLIPASRGTFKVIWSEPVSGDHRGVLFGGRSVLAETKTVYDGNLTYSHLREHQPERLSEHAGLGGLSLLVWVHHSGIYIMEWGLNGIEGFAPRKSITPERARELHIEDLRKYR